MASASQPCQPHFLLIPLMAQGHLLPAVDIAKLLAQRNVIVTIVTTPLNAARFSNIINRSIHAGLLINVIQIKFPATQAGLPDGCESADAVPSLDLFKNFFTAISMLHEPVENLFHELKPSPSCIISDRNIAWTADISSKFQIPRILFDGTNCFSLLCLHNLYKSKIHETASESESLVIPGLSDKFEFRRSQLPGLFNPGSNRDLNKLREEIKAAEAGAYGIIVNSFEELETEFLKGNRSATGRKVWCVGPVSLCNKENLDMAQRGNSKSSTDVNQYLKWLNSWPPNSVIYACLGSLSNLRPPQLIELGLGLEATNRPFIWVIRGMSAEMAKWLEEDRFEERVKSRGLLIRGWAPQVLILSHPSIGAFLTHCGWNSTLEGICAGVPMITWPLFAEQFFNEKLVVQVLKIGVPVGAEVVVHFGEEEKFGVQVKEEKIKEAVEKVMNEDKKEPRRNEARKLAEMAKKAVEEGGSSYNNITLLIEDIIQQQLSKREKVTMLET
ncbi:UDP-glycosyltransferase 73C4-like [Pistacia vera]|uniref:UDP-glycosyltransferase 73C4-like n=1 Tax=Pistacia vera TaxID=55513 RepID=UPI00126310A4|nr:UDP-glycosyltransferase 73C4-like [Pistacia vera]